MNVSMRALAISLALLAAGPTPARAVDDAGAEALLKKSKCMTCHSVDKKKDGPSYKDVASKYKGKAGAEQELFTHITTGPKVKVDGKEETHESLKTKKDDEVRNVVRWILSR